MKGTRVPRHAITTTRRVGYSQLGTHGSLGYEGKPVQVRRQHYKLALSMHASACLTFNMGGCFARFYCQMVLNDDTYALYHLEHKIAALLAKQADLAGFEKSSFCKLTRWKFGFVPSISVAA